MATDFGARKKEKLSQEKMLFSTREDLTLKALQVKLDTGTQQGTRN